MVISPLPTTDGDTGTEVSSTDALNVFVIRMTPFDLYNITAVIDNFLNHFTEIDSWFIAREISPKEHFHMVVRSDYDLKFMKELVQAFIYPYYPIRKRGFGSAQYNIQESSTESKAISYAIKDRIEYKYKGYTDEYIEGCLEESFTKTANFKTDYKTLCKEFIEDNMADNIFMERYIILKSKHEQKVSVQDAYAYLLSNKVLRDPTEAIRLANNFLRDK